MKRELEVLQKVDHPNILKLFESFEDEKYLHLVTELCTGGDLQERIIDEGSLSEFEASNVMRKIMGAVNYMHSNRISHRDLKPENFLYESKTSNEVKVIDFGMASFFIPTFHMKSLAGTPGYWAPEVLKGSYSPACDVWSLGVILYFILSSKHPFEGQSLQVTLSKSLKGNFSFTGPDWEKVSPEAKDLISKMLIVHPSSRITLQKALSHKWFQLNSEHSKTKIPAKVFNALREAKAHSKLWQEALKVVIKTLTPLQINELKNAFLAIDKTKSGFITAKNLEEAMVFNGFDVTREEIERIVQNCGYLNEGKINYQDFLVATLDKKKFVNEEILWEAFRFFDCDADGKLSLKDFEKAFRKCGADINFEVFRQVILQQDDGFSENMEFEKFLETFRNFQDFDEFDELECCSARDIARKITNKFEDEVERKKTRMNN
jgi:calcium-dependent protein kinase